MTAREKKKLAKERKAERYRQEKGKQVVTDQPSNLNIKSIEVYLEKLYL